jgi:dolichyl-phosphate-mannose--protein O-mannosyl transferase
MARKAVGIKRWWEDAFLVDAIPAALVMLPTVALTYLATWTSWFTSSGSYMRQWATENPGQGVSWLPPALRSLWAYHAQMWTFHNGLTSPHDYAAHPLGWIVQWRPTSFYWQKWEYGEHGCTSVGGCTQAVTSIGNPLLWGVGAISIVIAVVLLCWKRDWRAGAALSGLVAGWLPWFAYAHRTIFTFYSIAFTPWVVLCVAYVITVALEHTEHDRVSRRWVRIGIGSFLAAVGILSVFFYPIWTAMQVPYWFWHIHMWLPSWV